MIIEINYTEIEPNVKPIWDKIFNLSIDYHTNAIHGTYNNIDYIVFKFSLTCIKNYKIASKNIF